MEKILEADGVTKDMLDEQQKKLQLIQLNRLQRLGG